MFASLPSLPLELPPPAVGGGELAPPPPPPAFSHDAEAPTAEDGSAGSAPPP